MLETNQYILFNDLNHLEQELNRSCQNDGKVVKCLQLIGLDSFEKYAELLQMKPSEIFQKMSNLHEQLPEELNAPFCRGTGSFSLSAPLRIQLIEFLENNCTRILNSCKQNSEHSKNIKESSDSNESNSESEASSAERMQHENNIQDYASIITNKMSKSFMYCNLRLRKHFRLSIVKSRNTGCFFVRYFCLLCENKPHLNLQIINNDIECKQLLNHLKDHFLVVPSYQFDLKRYYEMESSNSSSGNKTCKSPRSSNISINCNKTLNKLPTKRKSTVKYLSKDILDKSSSSLVEFTKTTQ